MTISLDYMPPLMFAGLVVFMLIGFPVAFSLIAVGLFFGFISIELGFFTLDFLQAIPSRIFGSILANELLLAIPFFTFMGTILEKCGLAEDMLDSMGQLFGPLPGGLGYSVIIVGFILGAITGTVAAQVIAMTLISFPVMMRYNYNLRYATGVLAASGTITQLVPPSLVLVVLADQLGRSVGDMYAGAWGPSLLQIALFALYTFLLTVIKPGCLPGVPLEDRHLKGKELWIKCFWGIIPCGVLIFLVLGTMILGIATPTEAGAMGAVGGVVLAVIRHPRLGVLGKGIFIASCIAVAVAVGFYYLSLIFSQNASIDAGQGAVISARSYLTACYAPGLSNGADKPALCFFYQILHDLGDVYLIIYRILLASVYLGVAWLCWRAYRIQELRDLLIKGYQSTARISAMVIFILIGSTCFSIVFQGVDGNKWVEHLLTSLPGGAWGFLLVVNALVFFLAFFLDFFEIAFIIVPMLAPVAQKVLAPVVGESAALIWFGVILCVNLQTSFMHPPFGFALFYMRGVLPKSVKTSDIYWGALPFVILQVIMVIVVVALPQSVTMFLDVDKVVDMNQATTDLSKMLDDSSSAEALEQKNNPAQEESVEDSLRRGSMGASDKK